MQFEITFQWNVVPAFLDAGIDPTAYQEFSNRPDHYHAVPHPMTCSYFADGQPRELHITVLDVLPWPRIQIEVEDEELGKQLQLKLAEHSMENSTGKEYKSWKVRDITNQILKLDGLTTTDISDQTGVMSRGCVEALMRHYDETDPGLRSDVCWLFKRDAISKADQPMVARWLVNHLAQTKGYPDGSHIVMQLYNHLIIPEMADDLIRILTDRSSPVRDGCLFDVFVKTKDRRVLEVAVSVLDDKELSQRALACIGRRKAKQHVEKVRKFLDHPNFEIRKEAKKTMKQLGFPVETPPPPVHLTKKSSMPKKLEEWSANLDAEEVNPILEKLAKRVERGFGAKEIAEVNGVLEDMKEEQTKVFRFPITVERKKTELWLVIFMDDVDSPDLEIHSCPELIRKLDKLLPAEK